MYDNQKSFSVTMNGEEIATFRASSYKHRPRPIGGDGEMPKMGIRGSACVSITDDDSEGWKDLLPREYEVEWHVGENVYIGSISREELQRMIDDGVMK